MVKYEDVKNQTNEEYFHGNQFSIDVAKKKYAAFPDETYVQGIWRVAKYIAKAESTEEKQKYWAERWFDEIYNDWWQPAGSIMQGADCGKNISLANCTTISLGTLRDNEDWDNLESIIKNTSYTVAKCASYRQGLGVDFSRLRPTHATVHNSSNRSDGVIQWMKYIDNIGYHVGQCLHGNTRIWTNLGYLTIREIVENKLEVIVLSVNNNTKVVNWFRNGNKSLIKVKTEYGNQLILSKEHKVSTPKGMRAIGELSVGDYIVCRHNIATTNTLQQISNFTYDKSTYNNSNRLAIPPSTPVCVNKDLAYLAGYIYGNGYNGDHIEISVPDAWPAIKNKLQEVLFNLFGTSIGDYGISCKKGDGKCSVINLGRYISDFIKHCGFDKGKAHNLNFPEVIHRSPLSVVISFFCGLFDADGYNSTTKRNISLQLCDYNFLYEMKLALERCGIVCRLSEHKYNNTWRISFVGHRSFLNDGLNNSVKIFTNNNVGKYDRLKTPFLPKDLNLKHSEYSDINDYEYLSDRKYHKYTGEYCDTYIQRISSIEDFGEDETFDITVDDKSHVYSAEGVLVSNSGRVPAMLFSLSCKHPDVIEFIKAKADYTKIQNANISVQVTNSFYEAVEKDDYWELTFTIPALKKGQRVYVDADSATAHTIEEKGKFYNYAVRDREEEVIKKTVKARLILELIAKGMFTYAEPGIQNIDIARKYSNSDYLYDPNYHYDPRIVSTNACSEQYLSRDSLCVLSSINVGKFPTRDYKEKLREIAHSVNRFLDNVNEMELRSETYATPMQKVAIRSLRRTGAGYTNLGEWLFKANLEYGSPDGNEAVEELTKWYNYYLYESSIQLGKEKGSFFMFNREKLEKSPFIQKMMKMGLKFEALRNVTVSSIAPTGTLTLMFSRMCMSYGAEPSFGMYYWKRTRISGKYEYYFCVPKIVREVFEEKGCRLPIDSDTVKDTWDGKIGRKIAKIIEENKDRLGIKFKNATEVSAFQKLDMMEGMMKWIDSSISITYMLPVNTSWEDVYDFLILAYKKEVKSVAAFPDKLMYGIVSYEPFKDLAVKLLDQKIEIHPQNFTTEELQELRICADKIKKTNAPKRPKEMPCDVHRINIKGEQYIAIVGVMGGDPYEIFAFKNEALAKSKATSGVVRKVSRGHYQFVDVKTDTTFDITEFLSNDEEAVTRLISTSLRHGTDISFIIHQLEKVRGDLHTFSKVLGRALKKYVNDGVKISGESCLQCGAENTLIRQEGCVSCSNCGWSKC